MRPLLPLPLLLGLAGCASTILGTPTALPTILDVPAHAVIDPTPPDLVEVEEAPLVSAVRNGPDGRVLILGLWADGRLVWSEDPIFGGAPYWEHFLDPARVSGVLHAFGRLFDRWQGDLLEFHPPGASHVELVCQVGGEDRRLASWHESFELNAEMVVTEQGVEALGVEDGVLVVRSFNETTLNSTSTPYDSQSELPGFGLGARQTVSSQAWNTGRIIRSTSPGFASAAMVTGM